MLSKVQHEGVENLTILLVALVLADRDVQLVNKLCFHLPEVALFFLFSLHHVDEKGKDGLPDFSLWYEGDFKERSHKAGHQLDLLGTALPG